jgi:hypothetical protein
VIPEGIKLMPIYLLSAFKHPAFEVLSAHNFLDHKVAQVYKWLGICFNIVPYLLYPRIYCITEIPYIVGNQRSYGKEDVEWGFFTDETETAIVKPKILAACKDKLTSEDAYLLDNGEYMNVLISSEVP